MVLTSASSSLYRYFNSHCRLVNHGTREARLKIVRDTSHKEKESITTAQSIRIDLFIAVSSYLDV